MIRRDIWCESYFLILFRKLVRCYLFFAPFLSLTGSIQASGVISWIKTMRDLSSPSQLEGLVCSILFYIELRLTAYAAARESSRIFASHRDYRKYNNHAERIADYSEYLSDDATDDRMMMLRVAVSREIVL